jgi:tetratricopeptide (TPR) repeat protein
MKAWVIGVGWIGAAIGWGCGSSPAVESLSCDERWRDLETLEAQLFEGELDPRGDIRDALLRDYAAFANACNGDLKAPEALFRRADLLRSKGAFEEAMTQLRDVHDHFPSYPYRARCAFLVGFIAETEMGDREQARLTYQQVIDVHPESEEAEWARISLEQLDLRADELLRNFQRNDQVYE